MRELNVKAITQAVRDLCIRANKVLPDSISDCLSSCRNTESNLLAKEILGDLRRNLEAAADLDIPICQDTGMAIIFAEIGQEVHLVGGSFEEAVNLGVARGYTEGLLRCSVVSDPLKRVNSGDNTPAVIHTRLVPGDKVRLLVAPKGFGSENMSKTKLFTPAASPQDIVDFVVECVKTAGSNPCPPVIVGVGIGGDFELCAYLAKKALCRRYLRQKCRRLLRWLGKADVGAGEPNRRWPAGIWRRYYCVGVNIEQYATPHCWAALVAVNMGCHVTRHAEIEL